MTTFSDLELDPKVLQAVLEAGYTVPTPIQEQAIPHALQGRDVLGIAQTGTGKTASFVLPMITMLGKGRARARMPRSLVLAPTRELAAQVAENFETYSKYSKLSMALLIGGTSFKDQDRLIDRGVDVLIATPGRLLDHFERGKLMLTGVQIMVVDEADRMLDMGFIPDIERIFKLTPFTRQTMFYSATMAPEITRITQEFLSNPVRVEVARQATTSETIEQFVCKHKPARRETAEKEKRALLRALIETEGEALTNGIIFCNRKRDVDTVAKSLQKHGFHAAPIHGDLDQSVRTRTLDSFRDKSLRLLIASDVAARGLDIPSVSHVFNFDVPTHPEDYVHRIGRTGRAGRAGKSITLCFPHEEKYLGQIEELVKKPIPVMPSPIEGSAPASLPPREEEEKPAARSRSRSRGPRKPEAAVEADAQAPHQDSAAPAAEAPQRTQAAQRPGRSNRSQAPADRPAQAPRQERDTPRDDRNGARGGRARQNERSSIVGLGDHVPAFLLHPLSVSDIMAATNQASDDDDVEDTRVAAQPQAAAAVAVAPEVADDLASEVAPDAASEVVPQDASEVVPQPAGDVVPQDAGDVVPQDASEVVPQDAGEVAPQAGQEPAADATEAPKPRKRAARSRKKVVKPAEAEADAAAVAEPAAPEGDAAEAAPAPKKPARKPRKRASAAAVLEPASPDTDQV